MGVLLGDELPEDELSVPEWLPDAPELLPLDGDVVEPAPPEGLAAELLPDEEGERGAAVEPLLGGLLEPLLFEPELSQATSEAAERKAAAISHLFSIISSPYGFTCVLQLPEPRGLMRYCDLNNRTPQAKIPCPIFLTSGIAAILTPWFRVAEPAYSSG